MNHLYLENTHADLRLTNGNHWELWWYLSNDCVMVVSHCPSNAPQTVVMQASAAYMVRQACKMATEGWHFHVVVKSRFTEIVRKWTKQRKDTIEK